mgnify:CR=1 FL=1
MTVWQLLRQLPDNSVDLVLTDPPYGIDYQSAWRTDRSQWKPKILNDKKPFLAFIPELRRVLKPTGCAMIFTRWDVQQAFIDEMERSGLRVRSVLIWDKLAHSMGDLKRAYGSRYESILFHSGDGFHFPGKRPQDVIACPRVAPNKLVHPNEKPVELLETLISQVTAGGDLVLDTCMGSGSTGVASVNIGRSFIGMELSDDYFDIASNRIQAAYEAALDDF